MKVKLTADSKYGKTGQTLANPECWRLAFPVKGCVGKAVDAEAEAAVLKELNTTSGTVRARLVKQMTEAGTMPAEDGVEPVATVEPPKPEHLKPQGSAGLNPPQPVPKQKGRVTEIPAPLHTPMTPSTQKVP